MWVGRVSSQPLSRIFMPISNCLKINMCAPYTFTCSTRGRILPAAMTHSKWNSYRVAVIYKPHYRQMHQYHIVLDNESLPQASSIRTANFFRWEFIISIQVFFGLLLGGLLFTTIIKHQQTQSSSAFLLTFQNRYNLHLLMTSNTVSTSILHLRATSVIMLFIVIPHKILTMFTSILSHFSFPLSVQVSTINQTISDAG